MITVCISNDPAAMSDHQRNRAAEFETTYPLTVGKGYVVVGMGIAENVFDFLVQDDHGGPCFAPAGMFELMTSALPPGWRFALCSGVRASGRDLWSDPIVAMWGYPELVEDRGHMNALLELDRAALRTFESYTAAALTEE